MNGIEVTIGSVSLMCSVCTVTARLNSACSAELCLDRSSLLKAGPINYLDEVVINEVVTNPVSQKKHLFTGNIVSIKSESSGHIVVNLSNGTGLDETYVKALTLIGVDPREAAYSVARLAGFSQDYIRIPGLDTSIKEIAAFIPFKGLVIEENEKIARVQLLTLKSIQEKLPKNGKSEAQEAFLDADGWLSFSITARHFAEAENIATEKADTFLSAYSSLLQYSYSQFAGDFIEWERTRASANLVRQNRILLVMLRSGSTWLRDFSLQKPIQSQLQLFKPALDLDIEAVMDAEEISQLPLLVWNRFRDSDDYHVVTLGIWQIFELLSSDIELPKRLTREQIRNLSSRIIALLNNTAPLTDKERGLIEETARKLNQRALMEKLEAHLKKIGVVLNEHEHELLHTFREIRNAIEHGRKPEEPSLQEIKRVKALTNRIILASLASLKSNKAKT